MAGVGGAGRRHVDRCRVRGVICGLRRRKWHAVKRRYRRVEPGFVRDDPEDREDRWRDGAHQRRGLHPLLVRPGHPGQIELQRFVRHVLAAGQGTLGPGPGITGKLGTVTRSDGTAQASYNGHPLYTYVGHTAPGQAKGNGLNLSGGVWHEVTVSVAAAAASAPSSGIYPGDTTAATDEKTFDRVYAVNVKAPFFLTAVIAPAMAEAGSGAIINLGSWIARLGIPVGALYSSTKGAMETLTRAWAAEFGPHGVRVNAVIAG
jgi:NAD(P)-dependent dehydrogenase (short-subunit alcohol dehydrogenase family)